MILAQQIHSTYISTFKLRYFHLQIEKTAEYIFKPKHASVLDKQPCLMRLAKEALPVRSLGSISVLRSTNRHSAAKSM